ncbi:hypothetical protein Peternella1_13 [Winogradskyella phage Peternella_1]|uniref:Uncharacterized protein n=1 Tax=Winogradskyella phage Peternella_1 TaxID=2745699 RepID=A0A8E4ZMB0_9CAUD|nr:hypothetical protein M1M32_gp13 [Winogradskyella phage Peternella_1]QQV91549.1 hypothetical protein Peternella1_13 [Winogradskyella phage Peternella_1]
MLVMTYKELYNQSVATRFSLLKYLFFQTLTKYKTLIIINEIARLNQLIDTIKKMEPYQVNAKAELTTIEIESRL